jgi:hypothetical protein
MAEDGEENERTGEGADGSRRWRREQTKEEEVSETF